MHAGGERSLRCTSSNALADNASSSTVLKATCVHKPADSSFILINMCNDWCSVYNDAS
jgi:hypothetical protein